MNISQCEITRSNDVLLVSFWFRSLDVYFDRETPEPCPCFTLTIEGRGAGEGCVTTTPRDRPRLTGTASKAPFHRFRSCSPNCFRFHRKMRGQVLRAAFDPFQQTRSRNPFDSCGSRVLATKRLQPRWIDESRDRHLTMDVLKFDECLFAVVPVSRY